MTELQKRARKRLLEIERARKDDRYNRVLGRFVREELIAAPTIAPQKTHPTLDECLWVGAIEPRILELLPAILMRRPKLILTMHLPEDLKQVLREIRAGKATTPFRGVPPEKYEYWVTRIGRKEGGRAKSITHRFNEEDQMRIQRLSEKWGVNQTAVIRRALQEAEAGSFSQR